MSNAILAVSGWPALKEKNHTMPTEPASMLPNSGKPKWFRDFETRFQAFEERNAREHTELRQELHQEMDERFGAMTLDIQQRDHIIHEEFKRIDARFEKMDKRFDAVMAELRIIKGRV